MRQAITCMVLAIILAACNLPIASTPKATNAPTLTPISVSEAPSPINTVQALPTVSVSPSATQTLTTKAWRTMLASSFTPPPTPSRELDCQLIMKSVSDGTQFSPNEHFSASWKVRNTGRSGWDSDSVEFVYVGGAKMYLSTVVHLQEDVEPGNVGILTADMRAPRSRSQYTTAWSLRKGDEYFCRLTLTISVE